MICKDYAKANNKNLKSWDNDKSNSHVIYIDANNLYGHSLKQLLPIKTHDQLNLKDLNSDHYSNDSLLGCFSGVDLHYLEESHDLNNDYPLGGEKNKSNRRNIVVIR